MPMTEPMSSLTKCIKTARTKIPRLWYILRRYYPHNFVRDGDERSDVLLSAVERAVLEAKATFGLFHRDLQVLSLHFGPELLRDCRGQAHGQTDGKHAGLAAHLSSAGAGDSVHQHAGGQHWTVWQGCAQVVGSVWVSTAYSFDAMPLILRRTIENLLGVSDRRSYDEVQNAYIPGTGFLRGVVPNQSRCYNYAGTASWSRAR